MVRNCGLLNLIKKLSDYNLIVWSSISIDLGSLWRVLRHKTVKNTFYMTILGIIGGIIFLRDSRNRRSPRTINLLSFTWNILNLNSYFTFDLFLHTLKCKLKMNTWHTIIGTLFNVKGAGGRGRAEVDFHFFQNKKILFLAKVNTFSNLENTYNNIGHTNFYPDSPKNNFKI